MDRHLQRMLFDILYALAARDGREAVLFGRSAPLAREAFSRSMTCDAFPEVWFELPLMGDPWFDLHLLASKKSLRPDMVFDESDTGGQPEAFSWFSAQEGVRQLALSWDTGGGTVDVPAVQVLVDGRGTEVPCAFLRVMGRDDVQGAYRSFVGRMPSSWFACYTGAFHNRARDFVRVECIVGEEEQRAYARDASLLAAHLRHVGVREMGETMLQRCQALARSPFPLELQFDIMSDGTPGPTLGASVRFACPPGRDGWPPFDTNGSAGTLMGQVEAWGLADRRWRQLADTAFAKRVSFNGMSDVLFCYPAFVKLRWRAGEPLDAKAYLLAGVQELSSDIGREPRGVR